LAKKLGLNGSSSDFDQDWFVNIGDTIVGSMQFNIVFPVVMECGWFMMRLATRTFDKPVPADSEKPTKSITIQQYVNKFAGPEYFMHYKYSSIMNIVYLTMMFGSGMPILFPIAMASLFVLYCLENYMLYYVFKNPPAYDEVLNDRVLANLAFAPIFMLGFGYWMYSSPQLLGTYQHMIPL